MLKSCCAFGMAHFSFTRMILTLAYLALLVRISLIDIKNMRIPDREVAGLFGIGLLLLFTEGIQAIPAKCAGIFVVSLPMLLLAMAMPGAFGGGDIKLMAAAGFCQGPKEACAGFAAGIFLAGIWSCCLLASGRKKREDAIAFGPFLCLGLFLAMVCTA